jgi:diaminohydroxyphosphoribosylaminopyrimidine deaminase/5-amino-6-(5-phosphoribosylamino)uracil reductase
LPTFFGCIKEFAAIFTSLPPIFPEYYFLIIMPETFLFSDSDREFMSQAIALAWSVKGKTFPNPAVGAVVVGDAGVVGRGATQAWGGFHAERIALQKAGERSRGATLYVTLEPCSHQGRTPPCIGAIIDAGIRRVVVAIGDPNPLVNGRGISHLRAAGIRVDTFLQRDEAAAVNEDFFWAITRRRAWITLKLACTLDGRIADTAGDSKWITSKPARAFARELRRRHAAIAVGRGTLDRDDPRLTVRMGPGFNPARCIFTSNKDLSPDAWFSRHAGSARSIVVVRGRTERRIELDGERKIEYWYTGQAGKSVHLETFTEMAAENNLPGVFIEGGQKLASGFLEAGLVNRVYLLYGNKIVGRGLEGLRFSRGLAIDRCIRLKNMKLLSPGGDTFGVTGIPVIKKEPGVRNQKTKDRKKETGD